MVSIMGLLEKIKASLYYQRKLIKFQERALLNPENLLIQVRMGDLLAKLKKTKEAAAVYELAAQQFIQKNLFAHAIALKKIIFRLQPPRDEGEQINILDRLYDQMLLYREKSSIAEEATPSQGPLPPSRPSETRREGLHLEPRATSSSTS